MTTKTWRFLHTGFRNSAENMAIDEAILIARSEGETPPTLRFYGWNPSTLSIGYFQKVEKEVDLERVRASGLGFVRRSTGGRAVLHDQEVTYSVILGEDYPGMPTSVTDSYRVISAGLLEGFRELGLQAEMVPPGMREEQKKQASLGSAACFDSPSDYELVVEGKKAAGSAQTRQRGGILQHGSILLDLEMELLFDVLRFSSEGKKDQMKQDFLNKAVAINQLRERPVSFDEVVEAMTRGFEKGLNICLKPGELTLREQELARELVAVRYERDEWNLKK